MLVISLLTIRFIFLKEFEPFNSYSVFSLNLLKVTEFENYCVMESQVANNDYMASFG